MSIPPLVCSTPPPPDQCEDDRDTEDFDLQYNLSQEDDGNDYNYVSYSAYIYSSTSTNTQQDKWSSDVKTPIDNVLPSNQLEDNDNFSGLPQNDHSVNKSGLDDMVIEDLNLKLDDQNVEAQVKQNADKLDTLIAKNSSFEDNSTLYSNTLKNEEDKGCAEDQESTKINLFEEEIELEKTVEFGLNDGEIFFDENIQPSVDVAADDADVSEKVETKNTHTEKTCSNEILVSEPISLTDEKDTVVLENKLEDLQEDEFGDFDNFQFISSENNPAARIEFCVNPWESEVSKNGELVDFTANFEADDNHIHISNNHNENTIHVDKRGTIDDESDDFGDFNDFKSSSNEIKVEMFANIDTQHVPVLSLYSPDNEAQIIDSINSVLNSIFTIEISEHESDFVAMPDFLLNETWGHLVDIDVRQPYIVNWNNSIGQKNLLKSLCIDSRNILFGPKWNNVMPKYAVNLTVAPLQPQKPSTPANVPAADDQNVDNAHKETAAWTDPFTSDGQEYTYAEALLLDLEHLMATLDQMAHKHSSFKISELLTHACNSDNGNSAVVTRPANADVFKDVIPPVETDKIYSTTLSVQPIRQINLPDTHIFTPTDSETPRSKTIHYDQGPTVLVSQPQDSNVQSTELSSKSSNEGTVNSSQNVDYWDFQDFQGPIDTKGPSYENPVLSKTGVNTANNTSLPPILSAYEIQILQPTKVEPVMPALNWPDPGEVKGTFDDFSEFISNTSWTNSEKNTDNNSDNPIDANERKGQSTSNTEILDDEFETFQSASPINCIPIDKTTATNDHNFQQFSTSDIPLNKHSKVDTFDNVTSKERFLMQGQLSGTNYSTTRESNVKKSPILTSGTQNFNTSILQPSIASTSGSQRSQQKTGQILQPLSLENYSQINWPSPGIDLQDLSRFNPVESLQSLKTDVSTGSSSKTGSPAHKEIINVRNEVADEDIWGDFVSSKPKPQQTQPKKLPAFADDDEWSDFVSNPNVKSQNGLNTISLNVHTNLSMQKSSRPSKFLTKNNQLSLDIPALNYVTPKSVTRGYNDKHFQNL